MAAAPRKQKFTAVPNLYVKRDGRTGKLSCQYKDVRTNKFHGLGSDLAKAEIQARQLNSVISQQIIDKEAAAIISGNNSTGILISNWIDDYLAIQKERVKDGEIKPSTYDQRRYTLNPVKKSNGNLKLSTLTTMEINKVLNGYTQQGKKTMALQVRSSLIDLFNEAIAAGHFPADKPNPAKVTKSPRLKVARARLTIDVFKKALEWSKKNQEPYFWKSFLLAITTGQRREDISNAQFDHIRTVDDVKYLGITQKKTGTKVLIPLSLRLESIDYSVQDVVNLCRDNVLSKHLLHHYKRNGMLHPGKKIYAPNLGTSFAKAIAALNIDWGENTPPSFHEIRSLAEREYSKQGINTQHLLGHKHQITTDGYADARGHDWIIVEANNG